MNLLLLPHTEETMKLCETFTDSKDDELCESLRKVRECLALMRCAGASCMRKVVTFSDSRRL